MIGYDLIRLIGDDFMAYIVLRKGAEVLGRWDMDDLPEIITVGSDEIDPIRVIDNNVFLSHFHIRRSFGDECIIVDQRDRNLKKISGTYMNKKLVSKEAFFRPGDKVKFADYYLELESSEEQEVPSRGNLLVIYGPYLGNCYVLEEGETKLGREKDLNDIVLRYMNPGAKQEKIDQSISRRLATFSKHEKEYKVSLFDGSHTEVRLNKKVMSIGEEYGLIPGDEIEIMSSSKSTILRFVQEGEWDFSPPKKSGDFFIRNTKRIILFFSLLSIIFMCGLFVNLFKKRSIVTQDPRGQVIREQGSWTPWISGETINKAEIDSSLDFDLVQSPAIGNVNGDNSIDIVVTNQDGEVLAFDCQTKALLWDASDKFRAQSPFSIVLKDLNDDQLDDVLFVTSDSRLCALHGKSGLPISKWNEHIGGILASSPVVRDIDGDGNLDVAVSSEQGYVHIGYNKIVQIEWQSLFLGHEISSAPIFINSEDKGTVFLYVGTNEGKILSVDLLKEEVDDFTFDVNESLNQALARYGERNNISAPLVAGKIDDSLEIIVVVTRQSRVVAYDLAEKERRWYEAGVSSLGLIPRHVSGPVMTDLDKDGNLDVVVTFHSGIVKAYLGDAVEDMENPNLCLWTFEPDTTDQFIACPAFGDLNKDGVVDIVIGGDSGRLYIINGLSGELIWESQVTGIPIRSSAILGDVDGDNYIDILCMNAYNDIFKITTDTKVFKNKILWSQHFGIPDKNAVVIDTLPKASVYNYVMLGLPIFVCFVFWGNFVLRRNYIKKIYRSFGPYDPYVTLS